MDTDVRQTNVEESINISGCTRRALHVQINSNRNEIHITRFDDREVRETNNNYKKIIIK